MFKNTAKITSADGVPMDVKSETTYHKAIRQYDLNYVVTGDPTYGLPTDNAVPATVTGIEYDHNQTLAAPLSSSTHATSAGVQGEWKFEAGRNQLPIRARLAQSMFVRTRQCMETGDLCHIRA